MKWNEILDENINEHVQFTNSISLKNIKFRLLIAIFQLLFSALPFIY